MQYYHPEHRLHNWHIWWLILVYTLLFDGTLSWAAFSAFYALLFSKDDDDDDDDKILIIIMLQLTSHCSSNMRKITGMQCTFCREQIG